jgi:hypothetical protein
MSKKQRPPPTAYATHYNREFILIVYVVLSKVTFWMIGKRGGASMVWLACLVIGEVGYR